MSLQVILDAIHASGDAQLRELETRTNVQVREILAGADLEAQEIREDACDSASAPATRERARIIHRANLESLHNLGSVREMLVDATLDQARGHLSSLRAEKGYPAVLRKLVKEAFAELDGSPEGPAHVFLEADPRDKALLDAIVAELGLKTTVNYTLTCWGGVSARTTDGQVVVINTLESRLERAIPYLRRFLASVYESGQFDEENDTKEEVVPTARGI